MKPEDIAAIIIANIDDMEKVDWGKIISQLLHRMAEIQTALDSAQSQLETAEANATHFQQKLKAEQIGTGQLLEALKAIFERLEQSPQKGGSRADIAEDAAEKIAWWEDNQ